MHKNRLLIKNNAQKHKTMQEDQIINKLKGLNHIKPSQSWKKDTISYIMASSQPQEKEFSRGFLSFFNFNFNLNSQRLAPVFVSLSLAIIIGSGFLLYPHIFRQSTDSPSTPTIISQVATNDKAKDNTDYFVLAENKLNTIKDSKDVATVVDILSKAGDKISTISQSKDPVATAKAVKSVAIINRKINNIEKQNTEEVGQEEIQKLKESGQALASLTSQILEDKINDTTAELIKAYEHASLTPDQRTLFQQAKEDYNNKNFEKALEEILQIQNN